MQVAMYGQIYCYIIVEKIYIIMTYRRTNSFAWPEGCGYSESPSSFVKMYWRGQKE